MRPYRREKVASLLREIISETIARRLHDPRISSLTTVTRVELSQDLLMAKVYVSVYGDAVAERKTMAAIHHAGGYIQRMVASEISLRQCPMLNFHIDTTNKRVQQTMDLLAQNRRNHPEWLEQDRQADAPAGGVAEPLPPDQAPSQEEEDENE